MNIRELHVENFGRWSGLTLRGFEPGLNVIYGPNESGKSTLLEFVRAMLYGFAPERMQRFVPRPDGEPAGGSLVLSQHGRSRTLSRHDTVDVPGCGRGVETGVPMLESFADAGRLGVDEAVFCRVFAIGLRELQELATLEDADVAARLYRIGAGDERAEITTAVRALRAARLRLLGEDWRASPIGALSERASELRGELCDLLGLNSRYALVAQALLEAAGDVPRQELALAEARQRLRIADAAAAVGDRLLQRAECVRELEGFGAPLNLPEDFVRRLEQCKDHIRRRRRGIRELRQERDKIRLQAERLEVNERWLRQAPQLAALADQTEFAAAETKRAVELQREVDALRARVEEESRGAARPEPTQLRRHISSRDVKQLKPLEQAWRAALEQERAAQARAADRAEQATAMGERVRAALASQREEDLPSAIGKATERVRDLRRRVQLDQRVSDMEASLAGLDQTTLSPLDEPLLSAASVVGLGTVFVLGMPLIFCWAVLSGGKSWLLGSLGVAGIAGVVAFKTWRDRRGARNVERATGEIGALQRQIDEAQQERRQLDQHLGTTSGKVVERLREAERQLMSLERMLPWDHESQAAQAAVAEAAAQVQQAAESRRAAEEARTTALQGLGLSPELTFAQVCDLCRAPRETASRGADGLSELRRELQSRERDLHDARRGQQEFALRVQRVFQELGMPAPGGLTAAKLQEVRQEIVRQNDLFRRRQEATVELRRLRRRIVRLCLQGKRWGRRRRALLRQAGVANEVEFFRCAQDFGRYEELRARLKELDGEITARLCGAATIEEVAALAQQIPAEQLGESRSALRGQGHALQESVSALRQRRDELEADLKHLAKDTSPAEKRLELGAVEEHLRQAVGQWRLLAASHHVVDQVRQVYERDRQPEVLRDASRFLAAMTEGKYPRIWTPLDEETLRVDAADGSTWGVESLSTGTREQIFLCLRLALAHSYARRGVELPLVLDDVLVNFDTRRSQAAAALLRDYAAQGQQVLLFTCHEHIAEIFRGLNVAVQSLPERGTPRAALLEPPPPATRPVRPRPQAAPAQEKPSGAIKDAWAA